MISPESEQNPPPSPSPSTEERVRCRKMQKERLSSRNDGFALAKEELKAPNKGYDPKDPYAKRVTLATWSDSRRQHFDRIRLVGDLRDEDADFIGGVSAAMKGMLIDKIVLETVMLTERVQSAILGMVTAHSSREIVLKEIEVGDFDQCTFFTGLAQLEVFDVKIILSGDFLEDPTPGVFLGKGIEEWRQQNVAWGDVECDFFLCEDEEDYKMLINMSIDQDTAANIDNVPEDVIWKILPFVDAGDLDTARLISQLWNATVRKYLLSPGGERNLLARKQRLCSKKDGFSLAKEALSNPDELWDADDPYAKRITLHAVPVSRWRRLFQWRQHFDKIRVVGMCREDDADFIRGVNAAMKGISFRSINFERILLTERVRSAVLDIIRTHSSRRIYLQQIGVNDFDKGSFFTGLAKLKVYDVRIILWGDFLVDRSQGVFLGERIEDWRQHATQCTESYYFALYEPEYGFKMLIWRDNRK